MRRLPILKPHHMPLLSLTSPNRNPTAAAVHMSTVNPARREKVVVVVGPTGCGKTKLSIDLASRFFPSSEIINSDKIQVYRGLDITTNKVTIPDRRNVPHHLLGAFDPSGSHPEFTPSDYRSSASKLITEIISRDRLPLIVGGSNSFIYALLAKKFNPEIDVFAESNSGSVFCKELRYECCFLWVDISLHVLNEYLVKRVDDMLGLGMFEELSEYFESIGPGCLSESGLNKAIGVPEFEGYFRGRVGYEEAVRAVKENSIELAGRQVEKIRRLREAAGWGMERVETTAAIAAAVEGAGRGAVAEAWEREVVGPSVEIVKRFLMQ